MAHPSLRHAINELDVDRMAPRTNEPINRKAGNKGQADLEHDVVESCDEAIKVLPMLTKKKGKWMMKADAV